MVAQANQAKQVAVEAQRQKKRRTEQAEAQAKCAAAHAEKKAQGERVAREKQNHGIFFTSIFQGTMVLEYSSTLRIIDN